MKERGLEAVNWSCSMSTAGGAAHVLHLEGALRCVVLRKNGNVSDQTVIVDDGPLVCTVGGAGASRH